MGTTARKRRYNREVASYIFLSIRRRRTCSTTAEAVVRCKDGHASVSSDTAATATGPARNSPDGNSPLPYLRGKRHWSRICPGTIPSHGSPRVDTTRGLVPIPKPRRRPMVTLRDVKPTPGNPDTSTFLGPAPKPVPEIVPEIVPENTRAAVPETPMSRKIISGTSPLVPEKALPPRSQGRPRKWSSETERKRAYRARLRANRS
jgi:hypothetical protein